MRHAAIVLVGALLIPLVGCSEASLLEAPPSGYIVARSSTSGGAFDLDGYRLAVDGRDALWLDVNGTTPWIKLPEGQHTVELRGLAANCSVIGSASRTVLVRTGPTEEVLFDAACVAPAELAAVRVLVSQTVGSGARLMTLSGDGSARVTLTEGYQDTSPDVSPDGSRIAFVRTERVGGADVSSLYVMRADGGGVQRLRQGSAFDPDWSPNGEDIVIVTEGGDWGGPIQVVSSSGGAPRYLTGPTPVPEDADPRWSPDGARVAFTRLEVVAPQLLRIWAVNADGTGARPVEGTIAALDPIWSPDGKRLAFAVNRYQATSSLYVAQADGSGRETLLEDGETYLYPTDWSADGTMLLFRGTRHSQTTWSDVYLLRLADRKVFRLTGDAVNRSAVFWPTPRR